jgi:hypothetical protein
LAKKKFETIKWISGLYFTVGEKSLYLLSARNRQPLIIGWLIENDESC